jgi:hypothetical protein
VYGDIEMVNNTVLLIGSLGTGLFFALRSSKFFIYSISWFAFFYDIGAVWFSGIMSRWVNEFPFMLPVAYRGGVGCGDVLFVCFSLFVVFRFKGLVSSLSMSFFLFISYILGHFVLFPGKSYPVLFLFVPMMFIILWWDGIKNFFSKMLNYPHGRS